MDTKERLKNLKIDSLYKSSLTEDLGKFWQRHDNIKHFLSD